MTHYIGEASDLQKVSRVFICLTKGHLFHVSHVAAASRSIWRPRCPECQSGDLFALADYYPNALVGPRVQKV